MSTQRRAFPLAARLHLFGMVATLLFFFTVLIYAIPEPPSDEVVGDVAGRLVSVTTLSVELPALLPEDGRHPTGIAECKIGFAEAPPPTWSAEYGTLHLFLPSIVANVSVSEPRSVRRPKRDAIIGVDDGVQADCEAMRRTLEYRVQEQATRAFEPYGYPVQIHYDEQLRE